MESRPFARGDLAPYQGGPAGTDRARPQGVVGRGLGRTHQTGPQGRLLLTTHSGPCRAYGARFAVRRTLAVVDPGMSVGPVLPTRYTHLAIPTLYPPGTTTPSHTELMHHTAVPWDHWRMHIWLFLEVRRRT